MKCCVSNVCYSNHHLRTDFQTRSHAEIPEFSYTCYKIPEKISIFRLALP